MRALGRMVIVLMLTGWLTACGSVASPPVIRLGQTRALPAAEPGGVVPLRVAVAAVISPRGTAESYQPVLTYLSDQVGRPVELVQRRTYAEINTLIEQGQVDVAFVCTSGYVVGHDAFGLDLLVAPEVQGQASYRSLLIVPADSPARHLADLRDTVFAFTDPMSFTGRVYPTAQVLDLGATPAAFFKRTFFTYSHDAAIRAVAAGLADGAAVDSLVLESMIAREPVIARQVRVIEHSPPFGIPPVVVGPRVRPQLRATLRAALLEMDRDPGGEGPRVLGALGIDRFVTVEDAHYDSVRQLVRRVGPLTP